jgi:hypothetical protein
MTLKIVGLKRNSKPEAEKPPEPEVPSQQVTPETTPVKEPVPTKAKKTKAATKQKSKPEVIPETKEVVSVEPEVDAPVEPTVAPVLENPEPEMVVLGEEDSEQPEKTEKAKLFFQGVGVIKGLIQSAEEGKYQVKIGDNVYPLMGKKLLLKRALALETELYLRVYPKAWYPLKGDRMTVNLGFQLVAFQTELREADTLNIFILRGLWQFIPQYKRPVLSIYRNERLGDWDKCKSNHLPLLWQDSPVKPFYFNPKAPKEEDKKPERYFCQLEARFIPAKNCFGFVTLLDEPTLRTPKYLKPIRQPAPKKTA